jgi:hypothetical protein
MSMLIFILFFSMILIGINPSIVIALNTSISEQGNDTGIGGLSAESIDIAETNKTDLMRDGARDNSRFGGLSAESIDIAETNKTDLTNSTNNKNITDFGGLSARSVNTTK